MYHNIFNIYGFIFHGIFLSLWRKKEINVSCCILRVSVAAVLLYNIVIQAFIFSGAVLITPGNLGHVTSAVQSHWHHVRSQPVTLQRAHRRKQTKKKRNKKKKTLKRFGRQPVAGVLWRWLTTVARLKWANSSQIKSVCWHQQAGGATLRSSSADWKKKKCFCFDHVCC